MPNEMIKVDKKIQRNVKLLKRGIDILISTGKSVKTTEKRLKTCQKGVNLLIAFLISTAIAIAVVVPGYFGIYPGIGDFFEMMWLWLTVSIIIYLIELYIFWRGIITVYLSSQQLGIKWRGIGAICGMIPVANLIMLFIIIHTALKEIKLETEKLRVNAERKDKQICKTKYPILLVHGVFFRDSSLLNYWGRISGELEQNGACLFYGNHDSASSVKDSSEKLARRIKEIVENTGCEKINIIAHSKGGLDSRAAISKCGVGQYVASLTTINTPHHGCAFADYLLKEISKEQLNELADVYNSAASTIGDDKPDFISAVNDLTVESCEKFNEYVKDVPDVYYHSVGSVMNCRRGGRFPLNYTYELVKFFDGPNDGLVGSESCRWGENFQLLTVHGKRGISHGDMIDLNRENIDGFDVREFYVQLVSGLRDRGL